ncbi:MAG: hypothetical protein IIU14_08325 [Ruminococcus sp.]|nr:hypothetical protein [Ruminococcus sp.]
MKNDEILSEKVRLLDELAMEKEVCVQAFDIENYLTEFYDFYEIKNRKQSLIQSPKNFDMTLKELAGDDVWLPIAESAESLFGEPERVMIFDDYSALIGELEGEDGLGPFFFVFDIMFCEYDGFALCFISGTNN